VITVEQVGAFKDSEGAAILYDALDFHGFNYQWKVLNMADYGIAQDRLRYWLLAWKQGDRPWRFPAPTKQIGWFEACGDLPFQSIDESELLNGQAIAIEGHLYHYADDTFLIDRKAFNSEYKIRSAYQPCFTLTRMMFTDSKPGDQNRLTNRWRFLDACVRGELKTLSLSHVRRLCGFPDWYQHPQKPAIAGAGLGYACSPDFVRQLIEVNLR
jgi:site-specific DNA-cytosine methylase